MGFDLEVSLRLLSEAALQTDEDVSLKLKDVDPKCRPENHEDSD